MKKKRFLSVILTLALLICAFPVTASAADYAPEDGKTLDISAFVSGDVITVSAGRAVTLNGNSAALTNVRIICEAGVHLTLRDVIINNGSNSGVCPLTFTGVGSKLILESDTTSTLTGGASAPGISVGAAAELTVENDGALTVNGGSGCAGLQCPEGTELTVSGSGTLNAAGSIGGAGIGGGNGQKSGAMTFLSGTIIATGAKITAPRRNPTPAGAGIGGGALAACGSITIEGGTITANTGEAGEFNELYGYGGITGAEITITGGMIRATGNMYSPGIGGYSGDSTITITGGTVTATGQRCGVGIGGFTLGFPDPKVTIEGGTVYAFSGYGSAGIGGCAGGNGGTIEISGGMVYASAYPIDPSNKDIGSAYNGTDGTLTISGSAKVFLRNNRCTAPTTTTHTNFTYPKDTAEVYGTDISLPDDTWTTDFGAYLRPCTLTYDVNGGSGAAPASVTQLYDTTVTLPDGSGLSHASYQFDGWNTAPDGTGTNYAAGANYTMPSGGTLYARWTADTLTGTATIDDTTPEFGQTLTASLIGGNNTGTLSYQWMREGVDIGSPTTSNTYAVVQADIDAVIAVKITSSVETGMRTSVATAAVTKAASSPATGIAPVLSSKTTTSITVTSVTGYEYVITENGVAIDDANWQDSNEFIGLSPKTAYDIHQRVKETDTYFASATSSALDVATSANTLTGTAGITGNAVFGQTLTAILSGSNNTGTLSYQWMREGVDIGSPTTSNTYAVVQADIDAVITVKITSSVETGTQTSVATAAVTKAASSPATGIAPVLSSKTTTSITVTSVTGYEYVITENGVAINDANWQDSNEFIGLSSNTAYDIHQRVKETDTYFASATSSALDVATSANTLTGTAGITGNAVFGQTLTAILSGSNNTGTLSYQWKQGTANIGTDSAMYTLVADDVGQTITVTISSSVQTGALTSVHTSSVDKADCATATGVTPVLDGKTHNSITLTAVADYEYLLVAAGAAVGTGTWQDSDVFTSLSASTAYDIYQRVKETATHKASETSTKLDVTTNAAPTYSASVSPTSKTFTAVGIGYSAVAAQDFTITNDGSGTITNLSATLVGSDFEISVAPASSISSAGTATVSVRPVTGLTSGNYTDTLTISADNGISLTVTLSFTVLAPTIDPVSRNYDMNAPADITAAITWNGAASVTDTVYSINSDVTIYTLDSGYYTVVGNDLTIKSSFFEDLSLTTGAALNFVFTFNTGDEAALTVNAVDGFVPVTSIIGVPDTATAGMPLTLNGTAAPGNATNQTVTWSVYDAGDTGASVVGNILSTTAGGVVVVRSTITNGATPSADYKQDFNITVSAVPVTTYNVTFSSNGSDYATKTVNAGKSIGSGNFPSNPTRSSYSFDGWFTGENGAGTVFSSATSVNATMTVYAEWTYSGGGGYSETTPAMTEKTITVTETSSELFKDAAGTITAEANMENAFSNSVEVKVTDTPEDMASFGLGAVDEVYPFDISLYAKGTNEKMEPAPGYAVTISLPLPENLLDKKELLSVVHKSDSGVVTEITSRLVQKNGVWYLVFEATEFSPYALLVRNARSYNESAGVPYYLDASGNKVFVGFAANGKYIAPEGVTVSVMQNDKSFTDITGHWAAGYMGFVTEREIFAGTGGNTFSPDTGMTRAMLATVIGRLYERSYGEIEASSTHAFTDCDYSAYYGKYIAWASENSIIGGVGNGKFAPDTLITREQMAAILYRFADFLGVLPNVMDTALNYPDADSISGYAKTAALYCHTTGVIDGRTSGVFAPLETATRAEVATIIQRFVEVLIK